MSAVELPYPEKGKAFAFPLKEKAVPRSAPHLEAASPYRVTAPSEADETSLAYFAMTPVL